MSFRRRITLLATALALAFAPSTMTAAPASAAPPGTVTRPQMIDYFSSLTGRNWLSGQQDGPNNNPSQWRNRVHGITGMYPGVWGGDFGFSQNDIDNRQRVIDQAKAVWAAGSIPALTWHACTTFVATCQFEGGSWPVKGSRLSDSQWSELVSDGTSLNTAWKRRLDQTVPYFQQLKDAGIPVLFRPQHEMNEGWSWWGGRPGANGSRKLFQITHDYLVGKGFDNIVWVWNVKDVRGGASQAAQYYPGDQYVDLVTLDVWVDYFPNTEWYQAMQNIARGKPIALAEVGRAPTPQNLAAQPKWTYFSVWMDWLVKSEYNTDAGVRATYNDPRVLNEGEIQIPTGPQPPTRTGPITGIGGKCIDVAGSSTTNGAAVQLWDCNGSAAQSWTVGTDGTIRALGKCLDVTGQGTANGTRIQLWDCNGSGAQQWQEQSGKLRNPQAGRYLDSPGGSTANGTQLQIWDSNSNAWQLWTLPSAAAKELLATSGPLTGLAGKCADVAGSNTQNGTQVQLYACNNGAAQQWSVEDDGTIRALGKCLDVEGGINANGTRVQVWDCGSGNQHQQWTYRTDTKQLVNPQTSKCLDVTGQNSADGTRLQIWTCNSQTNQQWKPPTGSPSCTRSAAPGERTIPVSYGGKTYQVTVYIPAGASPTTRLPLVMNLHGTQGTGSNQLYYTDMKPAADAGQYLVLAPTGVIPAGSGFAWSVPNVGTPGPRDDVGFLSAALDVATTQLCADPTRLYGTGYSGGARMLSGFACARPDRLAAIAPVAGLRSGRPDPADTSRPDPESCKPSTAVPVAAFHGQQDNSNPYNGGGSDLWKYSVPTAQARWASLDGCQPNPVSQQISTHVTRLAYQGCRDNTEVALYRVSDGGHTWPGSPHPSSGNGNTTQEISANTLMWQFFQNYHR